MGGTKVQLTVWLLLLFISSCNYTVIKEEMRPFKVSEALLNSVSFNQVKIEVFNNKCISCHGNSGNVNLESHRAAYQHLENIRRSTLIKKTMPKSPYPALNRRELEVLSAWIEAGGPDKPLNGSDEPEIEDEAIQPTYASIKKNVIDMKCISCHRPGGEADRIPLNTREDLLDPTYEIVVPHDPDFSGLMIVIEPGARKFMPPTDSGISPVTEEEKNAIRTWIENGAL